MAKINILPNHIAELIAAGEVVERPLSIVKELIENSIDAGATNITIEIKDGGISFIRITDNGCGISKEDLIGSKRSREIAQARHMTIYLIRDITEMSYPNIGKIFNRDHTTILSSCEIIENKLKHDAMTVLDVSEMKKEVTGYSE